MNKAYSRINFQNAPSTATPLNATNLNKMDKAINDLDDRIIELSGYQEEAEESAEMASASASAAAKAAETATADAEARVNEVIQGLEVYTKADSHKKFASVIKQVATGSPILIKDSADGTLIDFKGKGRSTQKQYSGKNLLKPTISTGNASGVTFTKNSDGSYTVNGTNTETTEIWQSLGDVILADEDYIVSSGNYGKGAGVFINGSTPTTFDKQSIVSNSDKNKSLKWGIGVKAGVTLNNVIIYPQLEVGTVATDYEPYVGGVASPNPNYPQAIKSVGDGVYFDDKLRQGGYDTNNGTFISHSYLVTNTDKIPCNSGDTVNIRTENNPKYLAIIYFKDDTFVTANYVTDKNEATFSVPNGVDGFHFNVQMNGVPITPSTAKPITVTINGKYALIVKSKGKNLLHINERDKAVTDFNYTEYTNESVKGTAIPTAKAAFLCSFSAYLEKGKTYTFSHESINGMSQVYIYYDKLWGNRVSYLNILSTPNYTHNADTGTYIIGYYNDVTSGKEYSIVKPMLRLAEITDATYEPYKETVTYIPLNEPLRSLGNVKDEVNLDEGNITRRFKEVIFDGSDELWSDNGQQASGLYRYNIGVADLKKQRMGAICTHFTPSNAYQFSEIKEVCFSTHPTSPELAFFTEYATLTEFKTWLQANPITVQYELAEPITETIEPVDIVTYDNVTYLTASDNADMEVTYATDTKSYIDSKFAELHAALVNML